MQKKDFLQRLQQHLSAACPSRPDSGSPKRKSSSAAAVAAAAGISGVLSFGRVKTRR